MSNGPNGLEVNIVKDNVPIRNYIAEYLVNDLTSDIQYKIRVATVNEFDPEEFLKTEPTRIKEQNKSVDLAYISIDVSWLQPDEFGPKGTLFILSTFIKI
ncbi:unnamed protein product, partial [Rotaria sordida]